MKKQNTLLVFASGTLLGLALTFCLGAADKDAAPKKEAARLQIVSYPNGGTGFFDAETSMLYVYDADLRNCYLTRKISKLGEPLLRP